MTTDQFPPTPTIGGQSEIRQLYDEWCRLLHRIEAGEDTADAVLDELMERHVGVSNRIVGLPATDIADLAVKLRVIQYAGPNGDGPHELSGAGYEDAHYVGAWRARDDANRLAGGVLGELPALVVENPIAERPVERQRHGAMPGEVVRFDDYRPPHQS